MSDIRDLFAVPEWLNETFFERILRSFHENNKIFVNRVVFHNNQMDGEHYASAIFRAKVFFNTSDSELEANSINLFIKTMPTEEGFKLDLIKKTDAFNTEMKMYEKVLPKMEKLLLSIGDETKIGPTLVYQSYEEPNPVIVLIDEEPNGFRTYTKPLNYDEIQVVIERIAKFHATSVFMNSNGDNLTTFKNSLYEKMENFDYLEKLFTPTVRKAIDEVKNWDGCEEITEILEKNYENFSDKIRKIFFNDQIYSVLTHSDFSFINMMFRNDGMESKDYLLIDYQFCMWNSPVNDILFLLCTVSNDDVRENHRNEVIQKYFEIFRETLEKLNYKGPKISLLDLEMEMSRCALLEYMYFVSFVPFQYIDCSEISIKELIEIHGLHAVSKMAWKNEDFKEKFLKMVNKFVEMGVFE
ncbi:uncharacterized protein LOC134837758 [Culicoides brevitarsis]|uniref:uncharacterized protein LOC134837758 n=1 Tax=Culicoides brevitarsis TaxID=469753 RepID=UPI00307CAC63